MIKIMTFVVCGLMSFCVCAGPAGLIIKGGVKTWDEIAKIALKASGKEASSRAVKVAAKTIEEASTKYGDDVAKVAMRGGVEVAEESLKRGGKFVSVLKQAGTYSDDVIRAITLNAKDTVKYVAKYGDDVVLLASKAPGVYAKGIVLVEKSGMSAQKVVPALAKLPAEQIPQVLGAVEKNPGVAKQFLDGVCKGGQYFVDKIFAVNGVQILTGTLGASAIAATVRVTAPDAAEGRVLTEQSKIVNDLIKEGKPLTEDQKRHIDNFYKTTADVRKTHEVGKILCWVIGFGCIGAAFILYVIRKNGKTKNRGKMKEGRIEECDDLRAEVDKG